jgi:hypothetical protein
MIGSLIGAFLFSGCGQTEFKKVQFSETESGLSERELPAKVDIVFVTDNTGSMNFAITTVESQIKNFIQNLRAQKWDYHVAKTNFGQPTLIDRVLVNPDYNSPILPDGTPNPSQELVPASHALTNPQDFLPLVTSLNLTNVDLVYQNTINAIDAANSLNSTGPVFIGTPISGRTIGNPNHLLRKDALLAVIVLTNGTEYSVDSTGRGPVNQAKLADYANQFKALRTSGELVRFYPIAASRFWGNNECLGGPAYYGGSYREMVLSGHLKGKAFDVCDASALTHVLSDIANDLVNVSQKFVREYLVLEKEPIPSTIRVFKNGVEIPQSSVDGWTYEGGPQTVNTITGILDQNGSVIPFQADARTGWVIRLHGSAKIIGSDQPAVSYERN